MKMAHKWLASRIVGEMLSSTRKWHLTPLGSSASNGEAA